MQQPVKNPPNGGPGEPFGGFGLNGSPFQTQRCSTDEVFALNTMGSSVSSSG
jgi:hypothetical protein